MSVVRMYRVLRAAVLVIWNAARDAIAERSARRTRLRRLERLFG